MPVELDLSGRVALITGGGRGIGRGAVRALAEAGASVLIGDIDPEVAQEAADEVNALGGLAWAHQVDVGDPQSCRNLVERAEREAGRLDVLFHAAGVQFQNTHVVNTSDEEWHRFIHVNLSGTFYVCRAAIPLIAREEGGSITLMASGRVENGRAGAAAYAASKGGVASFTYSLAWEMGPLGVNVNCLVPGVTDTDGTRAFQRGIGVDPADAHARFAADDPMGAVSSPADVASTVLYLATAGRWITGQMHTLRVYTW